MGVATSQMMGGATSVVSSYLCVCVDVPEV